MAAPNIDQCSNHDDCVIVFTGFGCPMCDLIKTHEKDVEELEDQLDVNKNLITNLRSEVADLKQKLSPS